MGDGLYIPALKTEMNSTEQGGKFFSLPSISIPGQCRIIGEGFGGPMEKRGELNQIVGFYF